MFIKDRKRYNGIYSVSTDVDRKRTTTSRRLRAGYTIDIIRGFRLDFDLESYGTVESCGSYATAVRCRAYYIYRSYNIELYVTSEVLHVFYVLYV